MLFDPNWSKGQWWLPPACPPIQTGQFRLLVKPMFTWTVSPATV